MVVYLTSLRSAPGLVVIRLLYVACSGASAKVSNHPPIRPSIAPYMRESIEHYVLVQSV